MADGVGLENRYWETNRGFESHVLRQLGNEVIGSPAAPGRRPFFGKISSCFEFSIKFEPTFLYQNRGRFCEKAKLSGYGENC